MGQIPLTRGLFAQVDDSDFEAISKHKWHAYRRRRTSTWYAARSIENPNKPGCYTKIFMHREIVPGTENVDHKDLNGLNNTRENLRPATRFQNAQNRRKKICGSTSPFKGVFWDKRKSKFAAQIRIQGSAKFLGYFEDQFQAAKVYDSRAVEAFGEFARPNFAGSP